jgi:PAS domain S-box-containing protein
MNPNIDNILGSLNDGLLIIDQAYTIVYANERVVQLCGNPEGAILGRKCHMVFHGCPSPCTQSACAPNKCSYREIFTHGQPTSMKHLHLMADGSTRNFEITAVPLKDNNATIDRFLLVLRDVTAEKKLQEELAFSHQTLEMLFANFPFAINLIDKEMRVVQLNQFMEALTGIKNEEARGRHCYDCWGQYAHDSTRHGREMICKHCQAPEVLREGKTYSYELRLGDRVFEITTSPVRDAGGAIIGVMEVGYDITERHRSKLALQQSEQRFRTIIDHVTDGILITDSNSRIIDANRRATITLGYSWEELRRLGIGDIDPDFSMGRHRKNLWEALGPGETATLERQHRCKDGSLFPVEIHTGRIEIDGLPAMLNLVRDISGRKEAEQSLRESENTYRVLFENSPNILIIADFSGLWQYLAEMASRCPSDHETFFHEHPEELAACLSRLRLSRANQAALDLFGAISQQEFIDGLFKIIGPESVPMAAGGISAVGRGESFYGHDIVLYHLLTGDRIYCVARWQVVPGYEDSYQRVILSLTDISARKTAEDKLADHRAQLQKLSVRLLETEEAERRGIATELHDTLGQSLTVLGVNLHILQQDCLPEHRNEHSKRIDDSIGLIEAMTEKVRYIMAELRPSMLDDYGLCPTICWYAGVFKNRFGIPCLVTGTALPRLPASVEMTLFRVVQEALNNVAKHAQASKVEIRCSCQWGRLSVVVHDNGKGFPQAETSTMPETLKLGLLSMGERLGSVGGQLTITSVLGAGTEISMEVRV